MRVQYIAMCHAKISPPQSGTFEEKKNILQHAHLNIIHGSIEYMDLMVTEGMINFQALNLQVCEFAAQRECDS